MAYERDIGRLGSPYRLPSGESLHVALGRGLRTLRRRLTRFLDDAGVVVSRFLQVSEWWVVRLARSDRAGTIQLAWPQRTWQIQMPERGLNLAIVLSSVVLLWLLIWLVRVTAVQVSELLMDALNAVLEPLGWPTM